MQHIDPQWIATAAVLTPLWILVGLLGRRVIRMADRRASERRR